MSQNSPEDAAPHLSGIPTAELEAWKERFTQDLLTRPYDDWSAEPVHRTSLRRDEG
jgi:hypothetical protein